MKEKQKKAWYKKWWVWLIVIPFAIGIFNSIGATISGQNETEVAKDPKKQEQKAPEMTKRTLAAVSVNVEAFKSYAANIKGAAFVKSISVADNKGRIEYFGSYDEFKKTKPDSKLTEADYNDYFESGNAVQKILVGENVRLLRQFPDLFGTSMVLPFEGKTYTIDLDRKQVNSYLGFKVENLSTSDGSWNKKFSDPYIYNDTKRQEFFDKFVKVK